MLQLYLYDTSNGRVLAKGSYDERGDGAAARALVLGAIDASTEYAPAGVKTARPVFSGLALDKAIIVANAVDGATLSGIPNGAVARIYKDGESTPRAAATVSDGSLLLKADTAGVYRIVLSNFPTQDASFTVTAT